MSLLALAWQGKGAARKLIEGGGVYLNNGRQVQAQKIITIDDLKWPTAILLRMSSEKSTLLLCHVGRVNPRDDVRKAVRIARRLIARFA